MKSIQSKILLVVISGLLVITAVVSIIAVSMTHEIMHKDADRILNNVTQKEVAVINDVLGDIKKSAKIMEHYSTSEITDLTQLQESEFLSKYLEKTKKMFSEIAFNTNGVEGYFFRLNPKYTDSTTGYYNLLIDDMIIQEMKVTDLSKYPENDVKNVGWYYTSIQKGEATWLGPYYFPGHNKQLISYTIPMYINSELLGVIGFDMDFEYLVNRIENISVYERGYAVLYAADSDTIYTKVPKGTDQNPHTKAIGELQNGMKLELRADYKDIQKNIHPMLSKIVFAFLIVLACSIIYTVFVTHHIVRPLKQLTAAAQELSVGVNEEVFDEIQVKSKDEIGTLSNVLKETYGKIREYTTYINALAYRDSLTGIKNSTAYAEAISELNKEIIRNNPQFGVLVADINNLKQTNDKYGHDVGNELIIHTAKILVDTFKTSAVFRIGGDEFAVILRDYDYKNYHSLLQKLDMAYSEDYITVCENKIQVSVARGIAYFDQAVDTVYEDVFAKADHKMYLNKEESKLVVS
ncbi:MAG: diguanylate cyclase [Clostridia bacterium]|nr:diguanylate cyclase [Clostridia bacterium]